MPLAKLTVYVLAGAICLSGCGESGSAAHKRIDTIEFESAVLLNCVKREANEQGAIYIHELTSLRCSITKNFLFPLSFREGSIVSTKGLEELTALKVLDLSDDWIGRIDVSTLVALEELNLRNNIFQKLDLSKNAKLVSLDLQMNPLTEVVLPVPSKLTKLTLGQGYSGNYGATILAVADLSEEEYSNIPEEFFDVLTGELLNENSYRRALKIDFSKQALLEYLQMDDYDLSENQLDTLPKQNKLKTLQLKDNNISDLRFPISPDLETLNVAGNKFSSISFQNWPTLKTIRLENTNLDQQAVIAINELKSVETVTLFGSKAMEWMASPNSPIKTLSLSGVQQGSAFQMMNNLERLNITDGTIAGIELVGGSNLKELYLSEVDLRNKVSISCEHLGNLVVFNMDIDKLNFDDCRTDRLSITQSVIEEFDFDGPQFSVLDLSQMQDLQQLFLMLDLAENGLHLPTDLAELSLSQMKWKKFTIAGVESLHQLRISHMDRLADMDFSVFKSLDSLSLSHCPKLWELDISPLENMTGQLEIGFLEKLSTLKAEGLQQLSGANLRYLPNLEQASRDNIEALTNTKILF